MTNDLVSGVIVYVLKNTAHGRKLLFLHRSGGVYKGGWWPVAGTPEAGEKPIETALRELKEETGLAPTESYDFGLYDFGMEIPNVDGVRILRAYVAYVADDVRIQLNHEHDEFRWISGQEAIAMVPASSRHFLEHLNQAFICNTPLAGRISPIDSEQT